MTHIEKSGCAECWREISFHDADDDDDDDDYDDGSSWGMP